MNVAITGGLGFIGSHLAERFHGSGDTVLVIDDGSASVVETDDIRRESLDVFHSDAELWATKMHRRPLDLVVHAAAPVGPGAVASMGGAIAREIIRTTHAVAFSCAELGIPLVNISSSEVYGIPGSPIARGGPIESTPIGHAGPFTARSEYGLAKATAECVVANIGGRSCSVRPFNTAGPRQASSKGFVLPTFCEQAKRHEKLTVYEPNAKRAFTHVSDVCEFIVRYWRQITDEGGAWNVGNEANVCSIAKLADLVTSHHIACTGNDAQWITDSPVGTWGEAYAFFGERNGTKVPDSTKARALGWRPVYTLDDVIRTTYASV